MLIIKCINRKEVLMSYNIHFSSVSHIGNVREINQDNLICNKVYIEENSENKNKNDFDMEGVVCSESSPVFGVFDGMGGEEGGEIASCIAAKTACEINITKNTLSDLSKYCFEANKKICEETEKLSIKSMGTTAAMLVFKDSEIVLCNIGDSKIFRFAENELTQISKDHVAIAPFGKKPPLSQNLGIPSEELVIEPYFSIGKFKNNDIYLICSDGLTDMVSVEEIKEVLTYEPIRIAVPSLKEKALSNGGRDNVSIILCKVQREKIFNFKFKNLWREKNNNGYQYSK